MVLWQDRIKAKTTGAKEGKAMNEDYVMSVDEQRATNAEAPAEALFDEPDQSTATEETPSGTAELSNDDSAATATTEEVSATTESEAVLDAADDDQAADPPAEYSSPWDDETATESAGVMPDDEPDEGDIPTTELEVAQEIVSEPVAPEVVAPQEAAELEPEPPAEPEAPAPAMPDTGVNSIMAIQDRTQSFKNDFAALETEQNDLLKEILDVMAEQKALLQSLLGALKTENEAIAAFKAAKLG
jgi:hypothetical protein